MFEEYIDYDKSAEDVLKRWNESIEVLEGLEEQLRMTGGISGVDYSKDRIQTSPTGDNVENEAIRKIDLANKIKKYKGQIEICNKAWERLTEEEKTILDIMYRQQNTVEYACQKLHCEKSTLYRKKVKALSRFKMFIYG